MLATAVGLQSIHFHECSARFVQDIDHGQPYKLSTTFGTRTATRVASDGSGFDVRVIGEMSGDVLIDDQPTRLVEVVVTLDLRYVMPKESLSLTLDEIQEFGATNGVHNAWPYLREAIQSACARLGLTPIMIPLHRIERTPSSEQGQPEAKAPAAIPTRKPKERRKRDQ